jgi:hypothetical protein
MPAAACGLDCAKVPEVLIFRRPRLWKLWFFVLLFLFFSMPQLVTLISLNQFRQICHLLCPSNEGML